MPKKGKGRTKGKTKLDNRKKIMVRIEGNLR